jgi:hypothetical protein
MSVLEANTAILSHPIETADTNLIGQVAPAEAEVSVPDSAVVDVVGAVYDGVKRRLDARGGKPIQPGNNNTNTAYDNAFQSSL